MMKPLNPAKDLERQALHDDVERFLNSGGAIDVVPILFRDDDPLSFRKNRSEGAGGARRTIAEKEPYKPEDAVLLHRMGYSRHNIAVRLKVSRTTINRWLNAAVGK